MVAMVLLPGREGAEVGKANRRADLVRPELGSRRWLDDAERWTPALTIRVMPSIRSGSPR